MFVILWLVKLYCQSLLFNEFVLQIKKYNGCIMYDSSLVFIA